MTRPTARTLVALALGLGLPVAGIVCHRIPPDVGTVSMTIDVSARATLDATCTSKKEASVTIVGDHADDRWVSFPEHGDTMYQTLVTFRAEGGPLLSHSVKAKGVACGFPPTDEGSKWFLELISYDRSTGQQVDDLVRGLGESMGIAPGEAATAIDRFESGDAWNAGHSGEHTFSIARAELKVVFMVGDDQYGSEIPRRAPSDAARFQVTTRFFPLR